MLFLSVVSFVSFWFESLTGDVIGSFLPVDVAVVAAVVVVVLLTVVVEVDKVDDFLEKSRIVVYVCFVVAAEERRVCFVVTSGIDGLDWVVG